MKPTDFKYANAKLAGANELEDKGYEVEPLICYEDYEEKINVTCWKMSFKERLLALLFGRVFIYRYGDYRNCPMAARVDRDF